MKQLCSFHWKDRSNSEPLTAVPEDPLIYSGTNEGTSLGFYPAPLLLILEYLLLGSASSSSCVKKEAPTTYYHNSHIYLYCGTDKSGDRAISAEGFGYLATLQNRQITEIP